MREVTLDWLIILQGLDLIFQLLEIVKKNHIQAILFIYIAADFLLNISSIDLRNPEAEHKSRLRVDFITKKWKDNIIVKEPHTSNIPFTNLTRESNTLNSIGYLTRRSFTNIRRQSGLVLARVLQVFSLGVILVIYFAPLKLDQPYVQSRIGLLQEKSAVLFIGMLNCIAVFPAEYSLYKYEKMDRSYSAFAFFVSYCLIEIPFGVF